MFKTLNFFSFCLVYLILAAPVQSQNFICGTKVTPEQIQLEQKIRAMRVTQPVSPGKVVKTLSITVHIVKDSLGNDGITEQNVLDAFDDLNIIFAPSGLSFAVCKFNYIDNFQYNKFSDIEDEPEVLVKYYQPNTINLYLVSEIKMEKYTGVAGYAHMPGDPKDVIVIVKGSLTYSISHEMGHYLGLHHTFEINFGVELVNGSNCSIAGDLICDTNADPRGTVDSTCNLIQAVKDINNQFYVPPVNNIMSYYGVCRCKFTAQQYDKMVFSYLNFRKYLW